MILFSHKNSNVGLCSLHGGIGSVSLLPSVGEDLFKGIGLNTGDIASVRPSQVSDDS